MHLPTERTREAQDRNNTVHAERFERNAAIATARGEHLSARVWRKNAADERAAIVRRHAQQQQASPLAPETPSHHTAEEPWTVKAKRLGSVHIVRFYATCRAGAEVDYYETRELATAYCEYMNRRNALEAQNLAAQGRD